MDDRNKKEKAKPGKVDVESLKRDQSNKNKALSGNKVVEK